MHKAATVDTTPKIVTLYKCLTNRYWTGYPDNVFWREFFLLSPRLQELKQILNKTSTQDFIYNGPKIHSMYLFAVDLLRSKDEHLRIHNALTTLQTFLSAMCDHKSSDANFSVYLLLGNIDSIDTQFSLFIQNLCNLIKTSENAQCLQDSLSFFLSFLATLYNSSLISHIYDSYDVFTTLVTTILHQKPGFELAIYALGLLSACDKFETVNTLRIHLSQITEEPFFEAILKFSAIQLIAIRDEYVAIKQDDPPVPSFFSFFTIRSSPSNPDAKQEQQFAALPDKRLVIFLTIYELCTCNKYFCKYLLQFQNQNNPDSPLSSLLSLSSYINVHQRQSKRTYHFSMLFLILFHILIDDPDTSSLLVQTDSESRVRMCLQRYPFPSFPTKPYVPIGYILDTCCLGIQHNAKLKISAPIYVLYLTFLHKSFALLAQNQIRLEYHWRELWRFLFSFLGFCNTLINSEFFNHAPPIVEALLNLLAYTVANADAFVDNTEEMVDLLYKLICNAQIFQSVSSKVKLKNKRAADYLLEVINFLSSKASESPDSSPEELMSIIKEVIELIPVAEQQVLSNIPPLRESNYRLFHKRVSRDMAELLRNV
ncbi:Golgi to plasma membrane transport protein [Schizosaccharomyces osmophilus]|uniref:Golgi to plasma membrane transport protein n=1 Tax=Schizosaccharomyces osmophilus TaxID=2545709 RepID=A0AAE9W8C2_9SCHI|nr:Golgi to plasma membrane transport protein [Schizosaccharomyces osmophilus]WBW71579.1 Golgi to plasma membrane transport protein [Schizosaccharomyces osmophilus]